MKTSCNPRLSRPRGYTLLLVITFAAISFLVLGAALDWCMTNGRMTDRNNQYFTTAAAAEAATEKVLSSIARDYASQGESLVWLNIDNYRTLVPTAAENPAWSGFIFSDGMGNIDKTFVRRLSAASSYQPLTSKYRGMYGAASTYRLISNVRKANAINTIDVGVKQDIQLATIPVFQ